MKNSEYIKNIRDVLKSCFDFSDQFSILKKVLPNEKQTENEKKAKIFSVEVKFNEIPETQKQKLITIIII